MAQYFIHTSKQRNWYVEQYLIPSMLKQGIDKNNIKVYLDEKELGCLESCMKSFKDCYKTGEGTWHLQDDIIISSDFKNMTEYYDGNDEIVCGVCTLYDEPSFSGRVPLKGLWYSFPCIYIPNKYAWECAENYFTLGEYEWGTKFWKNKKKGDDIVFKLFLERYYPDIYGINLKPNIVNHIDWLIGGSLVNKNRPEDKVEAKYWNEPELVEELERRLKEDGKCWSK